MNTEPTARSIDQAMNYFMEHPIGMVLCIGQNGEERNCESFNEAKEFFLENQED